MKFRLVLVLFCFALVVSQSFAQESDIQAVIKAVENGETSAMWELGERYWDGNGVEISIEKAWQLWKTAADKGDPEDLYEYGVRIIELGLHVEDEANYNEAFALFVKAAKAGHVGAMARLGDCYQNGQGVEVDIKQAVEWYQKAASKRNTDALLALGELSEEGLGVNLSLANAVYFYNLAAELGNEDARFFLGYMYFEGRAVKKNLKKAMELLEQAARGDQVDAQFELAKCYAEGIGVEKNDIAAVRWLKKAVNQDHYEARYHLALHFYEGLGVQKDLVKAYLLLHNLDLFEPASDNEDESSAIAAAGSELLQVIEAEMTPKQLEEAKEAAARGPNDDTEEDENP